MFLYRYISASFLMLIFILCPNNGHTTPLPQDTTRNHFHAVLTYAEQHAIHGPARLTLADQAQLDLPTGMKFIPQAPANALMAMSGNTHSTHRIGLILEDSTPSSWLMDIEWHDDGYVHDTDAAQLNASKLLKIFQDDTNESNSDRLKQGFPALHMIGWAVAPNYTQEQHRLTWSSLVQTGDDSSQKDLVINYHTRLLGRYGYVSINLIDHQSHFVHSKSLTDTVIHQLTYKPGHSYTDYNAATDRSAGYGLLRLLGVEASPPPSPLLSYGKWGLLVGVVIILFLMFRRITTRFFSSPS